MNTEESRDAKKFRKQWEGKWLVGIYQISIFPYPGIGYPCRLFMGPVVGIMCQSFARKRMRHCGMVSVHLQNIGESEELEVLPQCCYVVPPDEVASWDAASINLLEAFPLPKEAAYARFGPEHPMWNLAKNPTDKSLVPSWSVKRPA